MFVQPSSTVTFIQVKFVLNIFYCLPSSNLILMHGSHPVKFVPTATIEQLPTPL